MSLNRTSQEETERYEVELYAALVANQAINQFEEVNLIGNQKYGLPRLPEESKEDSSSS